MGELMAITAMTRPTLYLRLAEHAKAGRAVQVSRGRWRAQMTQEPPHESAPAFPATAPSQRPVLA